MDGDMTHHLVGFNSLINMGQLRNAVIYQESDYVCFWGQELAARRQKVDWKIVHAQKLDVIIRWRTCRISRRKCICRKTCGDRGADCRCALHSVEERREL